jgi:hypothetical protein
LAQLAEPICGGTLSSTAAAETTEELRVGVKGARAAPAQPQRLPGEEGVCVSEMGGSSPSCRWFDLARVGGRVAVPTVGEVSRGWASGRRPSLWMFELVGLCGVRAEALQFLRHLEFFSGSHGATFS